MRDPVVFPASSASTAVSILRAGEVLSGSPQLTRPARYHDATQTRRCAIATGTGGPTAITNPATQRPAPQAGRRLVVVANRLPVRQVKKDGKDTWETSPGGLVAALHPFLREHGGGWVGWAGRAEHDDESTPRFRHDDIDIRPVSLTQKMLEGFYNGFSNETIWPLYHDCIRAPQFHRHWWRQYVKVNQRFADATLEEAGEDDIIWIQDYQLQLVPAMIRTARPKARIGFFNHIPFPPEELFAKLPWRRQILDGLLGADLIGFQTQLAADNFARAAQLYAGATGTETELFHQDRRIQVDAFPISIDTKQFEDKASEPEIIKAAAQLKKDFNDRRIILGVDRLDYTKGIDVRMRAYEEVLARGRVTVDDVVFVQIAVPTREQVEDYAGLRASVEEAVGRINGTHSRLGRIAVHYVYRGIPWDRLISLYRAADAMVVTPFRDGMNLVAKEYVATRTDNSGVLVLSEFAGAALELKQALLVNPHDVDGMADALERALTIDPDDAARRMAAMRRSVSRHDVFVWSKSFLDRLAGGRA